MKKLQEAVPLAFCVIDRRAIFLDVGSDRYFCLPSNLNAAFIDGLTDPEGLQDDVQASLIRLHVMPGPSNRLPPVQPRICLPTQAFDPGDPRRFLLPATIAQNRMRFRLRRWSFAKIIGAERQRHKTHHSNVETLELSWLYGSFCALATWFGEEDQCLARALAYRMIALRRGHAASLVIGVKFDPFAAHCWVQDGPRLLNDRLERVRLFTPIMVL